MHIPTDLAPVLVPLVLGVIQVFEVDLPRITVDNLVICPGLEHPLELPQLERPWLTRWKDHIAHQ